MDEHVGNDFPGYSKGISANGRKLLDIEGVERGSYPTVDVTYLLRTCVHCEEPPCAKVAPDAVSKRADGIVIIDPDLAKGRREIVDACPVGAVVWNDEFDIPQQWTMDAHLLDAGWRSSRASQSCPTGALTTLKLSEAELERLRNEQEVEDSVANLGLRSQVLCRNTARARCVFVAGVIYVRQAGHYHCSHGIKVELRSKHDNRSLGSSVTNAFGVFLIDGLSRSVEDCILSIDMFGRRLVETRVVTDEARFIGYLYVDGDEATWRRADDDGA